MSDTHTSLLHLPGEWVISLLRYVRHSEAEGEPLVLPSSDLIPASKNNRLEWHECRKTR